MSNDQQQEHPGPEWVESETGRAFFNPGLNFVVIIGEPPSDPRLDAMRVYGTVDRAEAIARCRAISAAALAWERQKSEALVDSFHNPIAALILEMRSR